MSSHRSEFSDLFKPLPSLNTHGSHPVAAKPPLPRPQDPIHAESLRDIVHDFQGVVGQVITPTSKGTGCLLKGNLLLTNAHVISSEDIAEKSTVIFSRVIGRNKNRGVVTLEKSIPPIKVNPQIYYACSPEPPKKEAVSSEALDYVIVGLDDNHPYLRGVQHLAFSIINAPQPRKGDLVVLLQYPKEEAGPSHSSLSEAVQWDSGRFGKEVTDCSVHYTPTSDYGSSGGAVVNEEGELVGLHYEGKIKCTDCFRGYSECRSGIFTAKIEENLKARFLDKYNQLKDRSHQIRTFSPLVDVYLQRKWLPLLLSTKELLIEKIYTRLAITGEKGQQKQLEALKNAAPGTYEHGRISTHESYFEMKESIELETLFEHKSLKDEPQKYVMIYGSAGGGKSTLCQNIVYRWAQGELWPHFVHVFCIKLRNLNSEIFPAGKHYQAGDIIAQECGIDVEVAKSLLNNQSSKAPTLLILDGEDELPKEVSSHLKLAFDQLKACFSNILVTSRHQTYSNIFTTGCQLKLEILGFDAEGINKYVDLFFADNKRGKERLRKELERPLARSLAHIPIHLEIFCSMAQQGSPLFSSKRPPTRTSIYKSVTEWLYRRYLSKNDPLMEWREHPFPHQIEEINLVVRTLERIAWKAMEENTLYLSKDQVFRECLSSGFRDTKQIKKLGPFQMKGGLGHFSHLTFQEYFAAKYLARLYIEGDPKDVRRLLEGIKLNQRYSITLPMVAGTLFLEEDQAPLKRFFQDLFNAPRDLARLYELSLLAGCFEECLDPTVIEQYKSKFIPEIVKDYKESSVLRPSLGKLMLFHPNLINHTQIENILIEMLADAETENLAHLIIGDIAYMGKNIPENLLRNFPQYIHFQFIRMQKYLPLATWRVVFEIINDDSESEISLLEKKMKKQKLHFSSSAVDQLTNLILQNYFERDIGTPGVSILQALAQFGNDDVIARKAVSSLKKIILQSGDAKQKQAAYSALETIITSGNLCQEYAFEAYIELICKGCCDDMEGADNDDVWDAMAQCPRPATPSTISLLEKSILSKDVQDKEKVFFLTILSEIPLGHHQVSEAVLRELERLLLSSQELDNSEPKPDFSYMFMGFPSGPISSSSPKVDHVSFVYRIKLTRVINKFTQLGIGQFEDCSQFFKELVFNVSLSLEDRYEVACVLNALSRNSDCISEVIQGLCTTPLNLNRLKILEALILPLPQIPPSTVKLVFETVIGPLRTPHYKTSPGETTSIIRLFGMFMQQPFIGKERVFSTLKEGLLSESTNDLNTRILFEIARNFSEGESSEAIEVLESRVANDKRQPIDKWPYDQLGNFLQELAILKKNVSKEVISYLLDRFCASSNFRNVVQFKLMIEALIQIGDDLPRDIASRIREVAPRLGEISNAHYDQTILILGKIAKHKEHPLADEALEELINLSSGYHFGVVRDSLKEIVEIDGLANVTDIENAFPGSNYQQEGVALRKIARMRKVSSEKICANLLDSVSFIEDNDELIGTLRAIVAFEQSNHNLSEAVTDSMIALVKNKLENSKSIAPFLVVLSQIIKTAPSPLATKALSISRDLQNPTYGGGIKSLVNALQERAASKLGVTKDMLVHVLTAITDDSLDVMLSTEIAAYFSRIAITGVSKPKGLDIELDFAMEKLANSLEDPSFQDYHRFGLRIAGKLAQGWGYVSWNLGKKLENLYLSKSFNDLMELDGITSSLKAMIRAGYSVSDELLNRLKKDLLIEDCGFCTSLLGAMCGKEERDDQSEEAFKTLVASLNEECSSEIRTKIAFTLSEIVRKNIPQFSKRAAEVLDSNFWESSISILGEPCQGVHHQLIYIIRLFEWHQKATPWVYSGNHKEKCAALLKRVFSEGYPGLAFTIEAFMELSQRSMHSSIHNLDFIFRGIKPIHLVEMIKQLPDKAHLVLQVCIMGEKSFSVSDNHIIISDHNEYVCLEVSDQLFQLVTDNLKEPTSSTAISLFSSSSDVQPHTALEEPIPAAAAPSKQHKSLTYL